MRDAMTRAGRRPAPHQPAGARPTWSSTTPCRWTASAPPARSPLNVEREYERNGERYALLRWAQQAFADFRVVPPGHRHRAPGQPRVPRAGGRWRARRDGELRRLPRHPGRHRLAHHDDQRPRRARLGRRRHRGRGGAARPAALPAACRWWSGIPPRRRAADRRDGHRPGPHRDRDAARARRGRASSWSSTAPGLSRARPGRPRHDHQHVARVRRDRRALPDRRRDAALPAHDRPAGRGRSSWSRPTRKAQGLFRTDDDAGARFDESLELDLATVEPSLAGPRRPQDRVALGGAWARRFRERLSPRGSTGQRARPRTTAPVDVEVDGEHFGRRHGAVVIAAITSCTNTSNPTVMVGGRPPGARRRSSAACARRRGSRPASPRARRAVTDYLDKAGLMAPPRGARFNLVGYGCTTCIGNSGPLAEPIAAAIETNELVGAAVLSGNRNFEGRIHPLVRASYLASPPLVVAFALAGRVDIDLTTRAAGHRIATGKPVYPRRDLAEPGGDRRRDRRRASTPRSSRATTHRSSTATTAGERCRCPAGDRYAWDPDVDLRRAAAVLRGARRRARRPSRDIVERARAGHARRLA